MPGGQAVRRLTLDEETVGSNPTQAAMKKEALAASFFMAY